MKKLSFLLIIVLVIITGCGGKFERLPEEETKAPDQRPEMAYEPLDMIEDRQIVPEKYPVNIEKEDSLMGIDTTVTVDDPRYYTEENPSEIYRIQLYTSKTFGPAAREEKIAREVFDREVYLDYEIPYYKIRVGNFIDLRKAEDYLIAAREAGYPTAWVVKVIPGAQELDEIYTDEIPPLIDTTDNDQILDQTEPVYDTLEYIED